MAPKSGFHSVIDNPLPVRRVIPPKRICTTNMKTPKYNQRATAFCFTDAETSFFKEVFVWFFTIFLRGQFLLLRGCFRYSTRICLRALKVFHFRQNYLVRQRTLVEQGNARTLNWQHNRPSHHVFDALRL